VDWTNPDLSDFNTTIFKDNFNLFLESTSNLERAQQNNMQPSQTNVLENKRDSSTG